MRINLKELHKDGDEFDFDSKTGELNEVLSDLLKGRAYSTHFRISPLPTGQYEMMGTIKTQVPEDCSRCGDDMELPIERSFNELLMPALDQPRDAKFVKPNHFSELISEGSPGELSVTEYRGHHFDIGEYLHELVALSVPFNPAPPCDNQGRCSLCKIDVTAKNFGYEDHVEFEPEKSPFEVLKKLK